jgi:hypothetical protein
VARYLTRTVCALAFAAGAASAQPPARCSSDLTLRDVVVSLRTADSLAGFAVEDSASHVRLLARLDSLEKLLTHDVPITEIERSYVAPRVRLWARDLRAVRGMRDLVPGYDGMLDRARATANLELAPRLRERVGQDSANAILRPMDCADDVARAASQRANQEKLRRFERKFGPTSPRLNGLEVVTNWLAQRLPGFGVTSTGWPHPNEFIVGYKTTWGTWADEQARAVSAAEFGVRTYIFANGWGESDNVIGRLIRPGHVSYGLLTAPDVDGALKWPWQGDSRLGGFLGWGGLKVAYLFDRPRRVLVSRELMVIPYVF